MLGFSSFKGRGTKPLNFEAMNTTRTLSEPPDSPRPMSMCRSPWTTRARCGPAASRFERPRRSHREPSSTDNGRRGRARVRFSRHARAEFRREFVLPLSTHEHFIASVWHDAFSHDRIVMEHSLIELVGHSLIAAGVLAHIHRESHVNLPLGTIFEDFAARVPVGLAAWLTSAIRRREFEP